MKKIFRNTSLDQQLTYASDDDPTFKRLVIESLEYASGRKKLQKMYDQIKDQNLDIHKLWPEVLHRLRINPIFDKDKLDGLPTEGPLIFIANHPFGVIDGIIIGYLLSRFRSRFHILANHVLCSEPLIGKYLLPIDFRTTKEALRTNLQTRKKAYEEIENGHAIAIFPAGGVSTSPGLGKKAEDLEWKRFVVKLILKSQASVVPIFFHGQNSPLFQLASHVNANLRVGLLLNEVRNKIGTNIHVSIGDKIPFDILAAIEDRQYLLDFLRSETYKLDAQLK